MPAGGIATVRPSCGSLPYRRPLVHAFGPTSDKRHGPSGRISGSYRDARVTKGQFGADKSPVRGASVVDFDRDRRSQFYGEKTTGHKARPGTRGSGHGARYAGRTLRTAGRGSEMKGGGMSGKKGFDVRGLLSKPIVRRGICIGCAVLAVALLVLPWFTSPSGTYVPYAQFDGILARGDVSRAVIDGDVVHYEMQAQDGQWYTENPKTDDFREKLLLKGVVVEERQTFDYMFNVLLDLLFAAMVFGGIGFAAYKLGDYYRNTFKVVRHTDVTFADVAGLADLKEELIHTVDVLKNPAAYTGRGIRPVKGILLEGPPGNGKTLLARALAQEAGVCFIATKGADFQSALMSLGARKIRMLFRKARRHKPCIVFIDEFDSIGERRNYAGTGIDKENNRIITAMLNEMDGFAAGQGILVVAATNSYRSLDPALIRPGRFDLKFTVGNPDRKTREELVRMYTAGKSLAPDVSQEWLVAAFDGMSCSAIETVLNEASMMTVIRGGGLVDAQTIRSAAAKVDVRLAC